MKGMGSHQSATSVRSEYITPLHITAVLGPFDLDPCAPSNPPWIIAPKRYSLPDDGLTLPWEGRVWCNPPYGLAAAQWLGRCAQHGNAIALVYARTDTKMFFDHVWPVAHGLLFIEGRLHFHDVMGRRYKDNCGAPSVLIAYDAYNAAVLREAGVEDVGGKYVGLRS